MAFVRLAGCSVGCLDCDTDYRVDRRMQPEEILQAVREVIPPQFNWPWVWITGGEPFDHDIDPLIDLFRTVNFRVAVATSGTRPIKPETRIDWISLSPHTDASQMKVRACHELKIVPGLNGLSWETIETEYSRWSAPWRFIQPLAGPDNAPVNLERCIEFVSNHPGWRLTNQNHKLWRLP